MKSKKWIRLAAVMAVVAMLSTGCSLMDGKKTAVSIDPPQIEAGNETVNGPVSDEAVENNLQLTVYLKDGNGMVAPVSVNVAKTEGVAKKTLEYMVQDGPVSSMLPDGFEALLPEGTTVKGLDIKNGRATVDFSKEFLNYNPQDERKILEGITWALTGLPTVQTVSIWVNGHALTEMPAGHTPVDNELSRAMGINLEFDSNLNIGQSVPVTVYFMNSTADDYSYYVPVTRLVERTEDLAKAAVEELIKGPSANKGLASVLSPETELLQVVQSDDLSTVTVNFDKDMLGSDSKIPASAAQAVILSVTQSTGASKVQLMVEGSGQVTGTDDQAYGKPVSAPVHINELTL